MSARSFAGSESMLSGLKSQMSSRRTRIVSPSESDRDMIVCMNLSLRPEQIVGAGGLNERNWV